MKLISLTANGFTRNFPSVSFSIFYFYILVKTSVRIFGVGALLFHGTIARRCVLIYSER